MKQLKATMGNRKRIDTNQPIIVEALRQAGASVQHLHFVGQGCPDILIGYRGKNLLAEIKDGSKQPSRRKLTEDEAVWHSAWRGQVAVIESVDDALNLIDNPIDW
jgi:hypothetical protein